MWRTVRAAVARAAPSRRPPGRLEFPFVPSVASARTTAPALACPPSKVVFRPVAGTATSASSSWPPAGKSLPVASVTVSVQLPACAERAGSASASDQCRGELFEVLGYSN